MSFKNKVVVITGATGGLGGAVLKAFLEAEATVAAVARDTSSLAELKQQQNLRDRLHLFETDITQEQNVSQLFESISRQLGGADMLVHLAGGFAGGKLVQDTPFEDWRRMLDLNLTSAFLCCKQALAQMAKKGGGKIVAITAMAAVNPRPKRAAYIAAKAGLIALTQAIAEEGKSINVQANAIAPGIILTEANKNAMPDMDSSAWVKPEDIAATILFLCSPAGDGISGTVIKMPGGA